MAHKSEPMSQTRQHTVPLMHLRFFATCTGEKYAGQIWCLRKAGDEPFPIPPVPQQGWGSAQPWDIPATGAMSVWIPLRVFAFLFRLSIDYKVFILDRMRVEYDCIGSTDGAVVRGIGHNGRLVTSAAMALRPQTEIKMLALGLAVGIFVDATVLRMLLMPEQVSLMGRRN